MNLKLGFKFAHFLTRSWKFAREFETWISTSTHRSVLCNSNFQSNFQLDNLNFSSKIRIWIRSWISIWTSVRILDIGFRLNENSQRAQFWIWNEWARKITPSASFPFHRRHFDPFTVLLSRVFCSKAATNEAKLITSLLQNKMRTISSARIIRCLCWPVLLEFSRWFFSRNNCFPVRGELSC